MSRSPNDWPANYRIGLPAWAYPGWNGRYFRDRPSRLANYAAVFNTVEGNTTFYGTPDAATVSAWRTALAGSDFRFCFKLPREVTHERSPDRAALGRFLRAVEPLGEHIGPLLVQFPAPIGPSRLGMIENVLSALPQDYGAVIEVRHPAFFSEPELLTPLLERTGAGRVVMDTRPLYHGDETHPDVVTARHAKPDLPVLPAVYNGIAFVRLVLHPDLASNRSYIDEWARLTAASLVSGDAVFMMIHCPNNLHCPSLAAEFHETLRRQPGSQELPPLPDWPVPEQRPLL